MMLEGCNANFPAAPLRAAAAAALTDTGGNIGGDPAPDDPAPKGESAPVLEAAREGDLETSDEPEGDGGELTR